MPAFSFSVRPAEYYPNQIVSFLRTTTETAYVSCKASPIFYQEVVIEWSIPSKWGACSFNIYKSETEQLDSFQKINPVPVSSNFFRDTSTEDFSKFANSYYKVEVIFPDNRKIISNTFSWKNRRTSFVQLRANEIRRRENLLLNKFTGVDSVIYRKRSFGERCSNCWDFTAEKVVRDHCQVCFGTSFKGGYYEGFHTKIQYEPTPNNARKDYQGVVEQNTIPAWLIDIPEVDVFDIIYRIPDARLYRVDQVGNTELQTVVVRQILQLVELDKQSVEFKLVQ